MNADAHAGVTEPVAHAPGVVVVSADEAGRFTQFAVSMQGLQMPASSKTTWLVGNDIAGNRNRGADDLLSEPGREWLWFIDDDHGFSPGILNALLAHEVDIVAPVVLRRNKPFATVACNLDGETLELAGLPDRGLLEVEHTGSAGMLIRRHVLEAIAAPRFEHRTGVSEDVTFCQKARAAGFQIHVDLGARMGHITTCAVWPVHDPELGWVTGLTIADGFQIAIDAASG